MKVIKRISELRLEQQRLNKRESELKQLIHADWIEIKEAARLKNILKARFNGKEKENAGRRSSWIDGISDEVDSLARNIANEARDTIETKVNETIEWVVDTVLDTGT